MSVKPFQYSNLKKVSSEDAGLIESLFQMVPATHARDVLGVEIRKMFMRHLGEKSFYYLDGVGQEPYQTFLGGLPEFPVLAVVSIESLQGRLILHLDGNLAFLIIDRLLGGIGEPPIENRPLSETEQGVLQYMIMQLLAQVWKTFGESARFHFRFERFCFSAQEIEKFAARSDSAVSVNFKVGVGEFSGFAKLVFTKDFLNKAKATKGDIHGSAEISHFINNTRRFDYVGTTLWAEGGRVNIPAGDFNALEEGDVVIFDETGLNLADGKPLGSVRLRAGRGEGGVIQADIVEAGRRLKCKLV